MYHKFFDGDGRPDNINAEWESIGGIPAGPV